MTFKICTVGCGGMATTAHGPSYARYSDEHPGAELAACCDIDASRAEAFRDAFGFARRYTDLDTMLAAEKPNAVCLVAPVELTCTLACRILSAGYPILMEKPPGRDVEETDRIVAAAEVTGAETQVAFNRRFMPLVRRFKELLTDAPVGVQHIRCEFTRTGRCDADFATTAIHGIDTVRFLAGCDYSRIRIHYQELSRFGPNVANFHLDADMASGATAQLSFCPVAGDVAERITVYLDDETFYLRLPIWGSRDLPGSLQRMRKNELVLGVACAAATASDLVEANGFYGENAAFFDAIRDGARPEIGIREARQSVEIAQCLRERRSGYIA